MNVNIIVNPIHIGGRDGWSPWDKRIGGTEECVINWAVRLKRRGYDVNVFHNGQHGDYEGVPFRERLEYLEVAGESFTINVNYPDLKPLEPTVYWTTLTQTGRDLSAYRGVVFISRYAQRIAGGVHGNTHIISPGYDSGRIRPGIKIPKTVLYASSPDRGLDTLLKVWPQVVAAQPDAQLIVTYGASARDVPNTLFLGEVSEAEMDELYATSHIWCHPANGGELYCMTGVKAQVAACWPVYFPTMALADTVKFGTSSTPQTLADDLIAAMDELHIQPRLNFPDWESTTSQWERLIARYR